jgi:hypothetical protein
MIAPLSKREQTMNTNLSPDDFRDAQDDETRSMQMLAIAMSASFVVWLCLLALFLHSVFYVGR